MGKYPKIYLAVDNCYGYKRFTDVKEWMQRSLDCGYTYIEASADTEADPLYMGDAYMTRWAKDVNRYSAETGAKVAHLYSGHGTYTTLGLAHPDMEVRRRFIDGWFGRMVDAAADVGAGLGFYAHGFTNSDIQTPAGYRRCVEELTHSLAEITCHARDRGVEYLSLENMYTPHMYPWTLKTAGEIVRAVYAEAGYPMYLTVDVGHMAGQKRFLRPTMDQLREYSGTFGKLWVGTEKAHKLLKKGELNAVMDDVAANPQLFADGMEDSDPYAWLERYGCFSPIIHMQQTDNNASAHRPFTDKYNKNGVIDIHRVLEAIKKSYDAPEIPGMPPKCGDIYITVEVFCGTMDYPYELLENLAETAGWMRQGITQDGLTLDRLVK